MTTINHPVTNAEFVASAALAADLQAVLVDQLELQNQAKQAHWNLVGPHFRSIHLEFDEVVDMVRENAERSLSACAPWRSCQTGAPAPSLTPPRSKRSRPGRSALIAPSP